MCVCVCACVCVCVCVHMDTHVCVVVGGGADGCIPLTMLVDVRQCCLLIIFVC